MRLPEETVVESFLPTFRFMLARELESRGLKEGRIAAMLGLSQAAVSKYHRGKTKKEQRFLLLLIISEKALMNFFAKAHKRE